MASVSFGSSCPSSPSKLVFSIHKCSSFSSTYFPQNILEDRPKDQSSRWSSDSNSPPQFIVLKLKRSSVVETITFGKFEKTHVCNLKKFKIFGGLSEDNLIELLESGLKNDSSPETFALKCEIDGYPFPTRFIKIVPLQSWGPSFNFSIWYVELNGIDDTYTVQPAIIRFNMYREREAIRVCLKHLRDNNYLEVFESLQKKTKIQLEHPLMTELHKTLVLNGDHAKAEEFLEQCSQKDLFHDYIANQDYTACWNPIAPELYSHVSSSSSSTSTGADRRPGMRGGHQMVIDSATEVIYLFGGWNGNEDLADFWAFDIAASKWELISPNTEAEGGPSARSCHKMILYPDKKQIFTLGRYLDSQNRPSRNTVKSDFYMYDIRAKKWSLISEDTASEGGPQLVFDHQMSVDNERKTIYVFGGRILTSENNLTFSLNANASPLGLNDGNEVALALNRNSDEPRQFVPNVRPVGLDPPGGVPENLVAHSRNVGNNNDRDPPPNDDGNGGVFVGSSPSSANSELLYSGLYAYHIPTNTWNLLRGDVSSPKTAKNSIRSRVGHSMLFHEGLRKLYVFCGQRAKEYLNDFWSYDVDNDVVDQISDGFKKATQNTPAAGFTQRATIDTEAHEIYIFSGLSKDKDKRDENVQNSFWVFDINRKSWTCVYRNDSGSDHNWSMQNLDPLPQPRFAHQLVYNNVTKTHYLFGGNPGRTKDPKLRLDDFWRLKLIRPTKSDLLKQCKLLLRRQRFEELAAKDPLNALLYLQSSLSELINHNDPQQTKEFQQLTLLLFSMGTDDDDIEDFSLSDDSESGEKKPLKSHRQEAQMVKRSQLFDKISSYFPTDMTQPKINLVDLLPL